MFILADEMYMSSCYFFPGTSLLRQAIAVCASPWCGRQETSRRRYVGLRCIAAPWTCEFSLGVLNPRCKDPSMRRAMHTPSGALYCRHHFGFSDLQVVAQAPETFVAGYPLNRRQVDPAA